MNPQIINQDKYLLIINKPAGMVVNRAETVKGETLQDWLENNCQYSLSQVPSLRHGIVHRLDKETSGVMVVAKTKPVFKNLQLQFKQRQVNKTYLALVHGKLTPKQGWLTIPLSRSSKDRKKFSVSLGGKKSKTAYQVVRYFDTLIHIKNTRGDQAYTLVEVHPTTGRTHQIRVVFKHLKHPIASDSKYLGKRRLKQDLNWCPRLFLHASKLAFTHPKTGKRVEFKVELPSDLHQALQQLRPA